ncbi:hypothetical protein MNV49_001266 [Pseudohyphozyma bogoriensis]|nr:hypothetical protein MNV49_001266 [Pseudohyphozyma bogoriensis]
MYCVLIEHPHEGLLLWEVGSGNDYPEVWGPEVSDAFSRCLYDPIHELDAAIASTGHNYKDVKAIIMGHLHLDHAGGLNLFKGLDVPIWVHEKELKNAFYSVATKADKGIYLPHYLDLEFNWQTFNETRLDFAQGIILHHLPGHTVGLCGLQLNLKESGTFIFTSDLFHVKENYVQGVAPGWVMRDHSAWFDSANKVKRLAKRTGGKVIMGHDYDTCHEIWDAQKGAPLM